MKKKQPENIINFPSVLAFPVLFLSALCLNMGDGEGSVCQNRAIANMSKCSREQADY